ncbi:MAG: hypothetical protein S0880_26760 [Actinomycetota bacterium]|nr:hypothetical protein [Actinomycetota bacterium]
MAVKATNGRRLSLATVLIGEDPTSVTSVRMKQRCCRNAGIDSRHRGVGGCDDDRRGRRIGPAARPWGRRHTRPTAHARLRARAAAFRGDRPGQGR